MNRHRAGLDGLILSVLGIATIGLAVLWGNFRLVNERVALRRELAMFRGKTSLITQNEDAKISAEMTKLSAELATEVAFLQTEEKKVAALQTTVPSVEDEQLRSFGHVEQMGREVTAHVPKIADFMRRMNNGSANKVSEDESSRIRGAMISWVNRLGAVGELEGDPSEIAAFHAAGLEARLELDGKTKENVRRQIEGEFRQLKGSGLARPQRPERDQEEWYRRRKAALDEATTRVEALIPPERQEPFAVGQSLALGTGLRSHATVGPDGHGSISVGLELPGIEAKPGPSTLLSGR